VCVGGADEVFGGEAVVMVAAGDTHAACVTVKGTLWTWGNAQFSKLGHSDRETRKGKLGKEMYGGSPVVMVSCGQEHTLVLTAVGVWSCCWGDFGQLGHGDKADKLVLTLVGAEGIRGAQIVMVAAGGRRGESVDVGGWQVQATGPR